MALDYSVTATAQFASQPAPGGEWTIDNKGANVVYYRSYVDTHDRTAFAGDAAGLNALADGYIASGEGAVMRADQKSIEVACATGGTATLKTMDGRLVLTS